jgi:hypothetical protein
VKAKEFDILIPYFPAREDHENHAAALLAFLQALDADLTRIHVFRATGERLPVLPEEVTEVPMELTGDSDSSLPRGWAVIVEHMAGTNRDAVVVDYTQPDSAIDLIPRMMKILGSEPCDAVVSVLPTKDNPCEFNMYFNILHSEIFVASDPLATNALQQCEQLLPQGHSIMVSRAFPFSWRGRMLEADHPEGLYMVVHGSIDGGLVKLAPGDAERIAVERSVFLWFEGLDAARQVAVGGRKFEAMPLMRPLHLSHLHIDCVKGAWAVYGRSIGRGPNYLQLFPETYKGVEQSCEASIQAYAAQPADDAEDDWTCMVPALDDSAVFMINVLEEAELPYADMELPYIPVAPIWCVDPITFERSLSDKGKAINGRQIFPKVFHPAGGCIAFSSQAMAEPLATLRREAVVLPCAVKGMEQI